MTLLEAVRGRLSRHTTCIALQVFAGILAAHLIRATLLRLELTP